MPRSLLIVAVLAATACHTDSRSGGAAFRPLAVGDTVPAYAVRTLAGDTARVGVAAPLTLLNVWATWCIPCRQEFGDLEKLHREYGPRGLRVLGVSVDKGADDPVVAFIQEHGATFTIGRDPDGLVQKLFQGIGVPETYLIGPDGRLLWRVLGALEPGAGSARRAVDEALAAR